MRHNSVPFALLFTLASAACAATGQPPSAPVQSTAALAPSASSTAVAPAATQTTSAPIPAAPAAAGIPAASAAASIPAPSGRRIAAVGDLHGDLASARAALQLAGAVDASGAWIGGQMVVVQVGDQTDRGDDEREILEWFQTLRTQAAAAGGEFHALLGNHEIMNVQLDLRYVTPGGMDDFDDIPCQASDATCAAADPDSRGRVAAFKPGGPWALQLAEHPVALKIDDTVFVHGGLLPQYAALGLENINSATSAWMRGGVSLPSFLAAEDGPVWSRHYSQAPGPAECAMLDEALRLLGARRMVVGHTVQQTGISSACDGKIWRVDVGLSDYYGGPTQALLIEGAEVRVLR